MEILNKESLFSFELIVNKLYLYDNIICRFPTISFRLGDFPTLTINFIEQEFKDKIQWHLNYDMNFKIPNQFPELKDLDKTFKIRRGKSAIFKTSTNKLLDLLKTIPLYINVMDCFTINGNLVASCSVALDYLMIELYNDIISTGIDIPTIQGDYKKVNIYNLMNIKLGHMDIYYRLFNLGDLLLSHFELKSSYDNKNNLESNIEKTEEILISSNDKQPLSKDQILSTMVLKTNTGTDTDKMVFKNCASQTKNETVMKGFQNKFKNLSNQNEDIYHENTILPPALFYNSQFNKNNSYYSNENMNIFEHLNWSDDEVSLREEDIPYEENFKIKLDKKKIVPEMNNNDDIALSEENDIYLLNNIKTNTDKNKKFPILESLLCECLELYSKNQINLNLDIDKEHLKSLLENNNLKNITVSNNSTIELPYDKNMLNCKNTYKNKLNLVRKKEKMTLTQKYRLQINNPKLYAQLGLNDDKSKKLDDLKIHYSKGLHVLSSDKIIANSNNSRERKNITKEMKLKKEKSSNSLYMENVEVEKDKSVSSPLLGIMEANVKNNILRKNYLESNHRNSNVAKNFSTPINNDKYQKNTAKYDNSAEISSDIGYEIYKKYNNFYKEIKLKMPTKISDENLNFKLFNKQSEIKMDINKFDNNIKTNDLINDSHIDKTIQNIPSESFNDMYLIGVVPDLKCVIDKYSSDEENNDDMNNNKSILSINVKDEKNLNLELHNNRNIINNILLNVSTSSDIDINQTKELENTSFKSKLSNNGHQSDPDSTIIVETIQSSNNIKNKLIKSDLAIKTDLNVNNEYNINNDHRDILNYTSTEFKPKSSLTPMLNRIKLTSMSSSFASFDKKYLKDNIELDKSIDSEEIIISSISDEIYSEKYDSFRSEDI